MQPPSKRSDQDIENPVSIDIGQDRPRQHAFPERVNPAHLALPQIETNDVTFQ